MAAPNSRVQRPYNADVLMDQLEIVGNPYDADIVMDPLSVEGKLSPDPSIRNNKTPFGPAPNPLPPPLTDERYRVSYYSASQAQIYFGDVFIDEINSIQFATITNRTPLYGYADKLFRTVATGNLIVQGSFTINYVEANYLNIIGKAIVNRDLGSAQGIGRHHSDQFLFEEQYYNGQMPHPNVTFRELQTVNEVRNLGNKEFKKYAREQEQMQATPGGPETPQRERFDLMPPFDIFLIMGDYNDPSVDHTVRRLRSVYLTGQSQTIISNGEPIMESYSFIARDID